MLRFSRDGDVLRAAVVVISGASSGVGRATALAFADHSARLVLAARGCEALESVAAECRVRGATAVVVAPTDVSDPAAVDALGDIAEAEFGHIDVWVSAAAVLMAGPFGSGTVDEARRLIDVNVQGALWSARRALRSFDREDRGTLIFVSSLLGVVPNPLVPEYVMSKFAIRGLALALQHSVAGRPDVHVALMLPGPIDTPMFRNAANHTGRVVGAIPPAIAPERVAAGVLALARSPRRQRTVGVLPSLLVLAHRIGPRPTEWVVARYSAATLTRRGAAGPTSGTLFAPPSEGRLTDEWRRGHLRRAMGARLGAALGRR
jgi:short-subunit dehydrogenase